MASPPRDNHQTVNLKPLAVQVKHGLEKVLINSNFVENRVFSCQEAIFSSQKTTSCSRCFTEN